MAQFSAPVSLPAKRAFLRVSAIGRIWFSTGLVSSSRVLSSRLRVPVAQRSFDPVDRTKADEGPAGQIRPGQWARV